MADNQPDTDNLYLGKYKTREDAEKGQANLINEMNRIKGENAQVSAQLEAQTRLNQEMGSILQEVSRQPKTVEPPVNLTTSDGYLDETALNARLTGVENSIKEALSSMPKMVQDTVGQVLAPLGRVQQVENAFFGRDDLPEDFDRGVMSKFLARNPGINKTHQAMINAGQDEGAYDYAYDLWKSTRTTGPSAINQAQKMDAGTTPQSGGPPPSMGEESPDAEKLQKLAHAAQLTGDPMVQMQYLAQRWGDSKTVENLKNQAKERGWKE